MTKGVDFMKSIKVIIGANFGDEGKGLMTDYLAFDIKGRINGRYMDSNNAGNGIVVRFNGGAQAGHTVTSPDGIRHVFGHFCSGALAGLSGYLSEFFVVNPMLFLKEYEQLKKISSMQDRHNQVQSKNEAPGNSIVPAINTRLYVDKNCMVTTPYDIMINQIAEISRGSRKHGSCGVGFNETITRCLLDGAYALCVRELENPDAVVKKLMTIRDEYMGIRLGQLGIGSIPHPYDELLGNDGIIGRFAADAAEMLKHVDVADIGVLRGFDNIIFEGAQGLLLDQAHEYFPHVTRSNTGIKNAMELIRKAGLLTRNESDGETTAEIPVETAGLPVEIIYVTRAYMTRHGAGPFPTELPEKPYRGIIDLTNIPNPYQDALRFGLVDIDALDREIKKDIKYADGFDCDVRLAVTCLDQLDEEVDFILGEKRMKVPVEEFLDILFDRIQISRGYLSYGPTRETIRSWEKK